MYILVCVCVCVCVLWSIYSANMVRQSLFAMEWYRLQVAVRASSTLGLRPCDIYTPYPPTLFESRADSQKVLTCIGRTDSPNRSIAMCIDHDGWGFEF